MRALNHDNKLAILLYDVDFIRFPKLGRRTKTGRALEYTEKVLFPKEANGRKEELIVITDSESTDDINEPAKHLKAKGVDVVTVGVGNSFRKKQLQEIASSEEEVFEIDFEHIQNLVHKILEQACKPPGICVNLF